MKESLIKYGFIALISFALGASLVEGCSSPEVQWKEIKRTVVRVDTVYQTDTVFQTLQNVKYIVQTKDVPKEILDTTRFEQLSKFRLYTYRYSYKFGMAKVSSNVLGYQIDETVEFANLNPTLRVTESRTISVPQRGLWLKAYGGTDFFVGLSYMTRKKWAYGVNYHPLNNGFTIGIERKLF